MSAKKKTGGRKSTDSLKPFTKTLPLSPSTVPETATVDDYQKVASSIITSSDEIIDRALDRIEGKTEAEKTRERSESAKKSPEPVKETAVSETTVSETAVAEKPKKNVIRTEEMSELKDKIYVSEKNNGFLRDEIKRLSEENDNYLLKNSELEFENSRLRAENSFLKGEIEKCRNDTRLPPQTYSKEGYTRLPQRNGNRGIFTGIKRSQNGYESWN
jgi:hypothetical protein